MAEFDWTAFLGEWSRELIASQEIAAQLPPEVKAAGWLGYAGASDEQIAHAEARLGRSLPPSYRAFLKCSNGWRNTGFFIDRLWSTDDLEWFRVRHQEWISDWNLGEAHHATTNPSQPTGGGSYEGAALPFTLEISDVGDSAIYLLNPLAESSDGEWQAWFFSNWNPGAVRYRSFQQMIENERKRFLYVRDHKR